MADSPPKPESKHEAMNEAPPPPPPAALRPRIRPPAGNEERISTVVGDRICTHCGFNLYGQPIFRESVYDMLIIRCPECGTIASIQEYPLLGRWASRWGYLLAAIWVLVILAIVAAGALSIGAAGFAIARTMIEPYAQAIGQTYIEWARENPDQAANTMGNWWNSQSSLSGSQYTYVSIDEDWWQTTGRSSVRRKLPGWRDRLDLRVTDDVIWLGFWLFTLGVTWSVIAPAGGVKRTIAITLIMLALAFGWAYMLYSWNNNAWGWSSPPAASVAIRDMGILLNIGLVVLFAAFLLAGGLFGRAVARWMIIALLPPRMRGWLAYLWIVDGKSPPKLTWLDR